MIRSALQFSRELVCRWFYFQGFHFFPLKKLPDFPRLFQYFCHQMMLSNKVKNSTAITEILLFSLIFSDIIFPDFSLTDKKFPLFPDFLVIFKIPWSFSFRFLLFYCASRKSVFLLFPSRLCHLLLVKTNAAIRNFHISNWSSLRLMRFKIVLHFD